jgi:saccharopine dehydrogenase-like NADP-dependent oxidoreductase
MTNVLLLGAGTIGRMIATLLTQSGDYKVRVGDTDAEALNRLKTKLGVETMVVDAANETELAAAMNGQVAVISALTFALNPRVARAALAAGISYFDLTEDVETTRVVRTLYGAKSSCRNADWLPASSALSPIIWLTSSSSSIHCSCASERCRSSPPTR